MHLVGGHEADDARDGDEQEEDQVRDHAARSAGELGFRVQGLGLRGFRVPGPKFRRLKVQDVGIRLYDVWCMVYGVLRMVYSVGCRVRE